MTYDEERDELWEKAREDMARRLRESLMPYKLYGTSDSEDGDDLEDIVPITKLMAQPPEATTKSLRDPTSLSLFCLRHNKPLTTDDENKPICWDCYKEKKKPKDTKLYFRFGI